MAGQSQAQQSYTRTAMWLHWLVAIAIAINLFLGFTMDSLFQGSRGLIIAIHASMGFSILALVLLRILWRIANRPPEMEHGMSGWERLLAAYGHFLLYMLMLLVPLSGWAIISSNPPANSPGAAAIEALGVDAHPNSEFKVWGIAPIPAIKPINELGRTAEGVRPQSKLHHEFEALHELGSIALVGLIILHLLGAAKHQLVDRVNILGRMGLRVKHKAHKP